jgi:hypothetical protein
VLRGYIATLESECAPRYARQNLTSLSNILETAIDDKRLVRNPMRAKSVRWPKVPEDQREAWPLETALRVRDAITPRYRIAAVVTLARWLGHSSPTITLDYYAHFMPEAGGKGRSAIDALLSRPSKAAVAAQ